LFRLQGVHGHANPTLPVLEVPVAGCAAAAPTRLISDADVPDIVPVIPLNNSVLFPSGVLSMRVATLTELAVQACASSDSKLVAVVARTECTNESATPEKVFRVGTLAHLVSMQKQETGTMDIKVQGLVRIRLLEFLPGPFMQARIEGVADSEPGAIGDELAHLHSLVARSIEAAPDSPLVAYQVLNQVKSPIHLLDMFAANSEMDLKWKQKVLEAFDLRERLRLVAEYLDAERDGSFSAWSGSCPNCGWVPSLLFRTVCACGTSWNSVLTIGECPTCGRRRSAIACVKCGKAIPLGGEDHPALRNVTAERPHELASDGSLEVLPSNMADGADGRPVGPA
jgi:Lon protease-like protein